MNSFYNDVNDWLSVGGDLDLAKDLTGLPLSATVRQLRQTGVTHVLDARCEWEDKREWVAEGLASANYCHAPITDSWSHTPSEDWFQTVENFVQRFWKESAHGDRLYVHCHMGINRGPSAAMLALLTVDPLLSPWAAFLQIREARPVAGLVYAEAVGIRHLLNVEGVTADDLTASGELPESVVKYSKAIRDYWTPERQIQRRQGIAFYRSYEGGTLVKSS